MKTIKKVLAFAISLALLLTMFSMVSLVPASAETEILMIYDGETLPTHQTIGTFSLSTDVKSQGNSSLKIVQNAADGQYSFQHDMTEAVDLADYEYLCIDYQIEHPWQVSAANEIYISLSGDTGRVNYGLNTNYFGNGYTGVGNRDGGVFHSIKIPLTDFAEKTTQISSFQIWQPNVTPGNWAQISSLNTIYFDNIRLERTVNGHSITASANEGGVISPAGEIIVIEGGSKTFNIIANQGMAIKDVVVDGVSVGAVSEYTFENVTSAHTISASFVAQGTKTLMLYDGETLPTYQSIGTFSLSTDVKSQGNSSLKVVQNAADGQYSFQHDIAEAVELADYDYLCIDYQIQHPWQVSAANEIYISLSGDTGRVNYGLNTNYFGNGYTGVGNRDGGVIHSIKIPLTDFAEKTTKVLSIQIWQPNVTPGNWAQISSLNTIYFDNIRLTGVCNHEETSFYNEIEAQTHIAGYTGDLTCRLCGCVLEKGEKSPAKADVNNDNEINIVDLIKIKNHLLNFTSLDNNRGDLDYSETVDATDFISLRKILFGAGATAFVSFGNNEKSSDLEFSLSNLTRTIGTEDFKDYSEFNGNGKINITLSDEFMQRANGKRLVVSVNYKCIGNVSLKINYNSNDNDKQETLLGVTENYWSGRSVVINADSIQKRNGCHLSLLVNGRINISNITILIADIPTSETSFNKTQAVSSKCSTNDTIVAETSVKYYGAVGNGKVDDTYAFLSAIKYVESLGGGTVFVPAGEYVVTQSLDIPSAVTLRGETDVTEKGTTKTIIKCYYGAYRSDIKDNAFVNLSVDAGLKNITIWYPRQKISDNTVIPYSWTVDVSTGCTVEDVVLINSYRGIRIGLNGNICSTIRNIYGSPLQTGIYIDHNVDITRFENINFAPSYWTSFASSNTPDDTTLRNYTQNNATAFLYERVDWTYFWDFTFDGYKIGLHSRYSSSGSNEPGTAGGQIYNANITNCNVGLLIEDITEMGAHLTNSTISATVGENPVAVKLTSGFDSMYSFNTCNLSSSGKNVLVNEGTGSVSLMDCQFSGNTTSALLDFIGSGEVSSVNSTFSGSDIHMHLSSAVKSANLVNNMTKETFKLSNESTGTVKNIYDSNKTQPLNTTTKYDVTYITKPNSQTLINISEAPYNVHPTKNGAGSDISSELQSALNALSSTGGIVYIPAGDYRLEKSITVPTGVELRGSSDSILHLDANGTTLYTDYGSGDASAAPLIILNENSGATGFRVFHDKMSTGSLKEYPYVLQGRGADCYVTKVMLVNPYQGIDFATYKCDRHFISEVYGTPLVEGIKVGGGSNNGVIRDCHFNPNAFIGTNFAYKISGTSGLTYVDMLNILWPVLLDNCNAYIIGNTCDELLYLNFVYGSNYGITLNDGADVFMMGNAVDGSQLGFYIDDITTDDTTWIIASQICSSGYTNDGLIQSSSKFNGTVNLVQTLGFGDCAAGLLFEGKGTIRVYQMGIARLWPNTSNQVSLKVAESEIVGLVFCDSNPTNDIYVDLDITSTVIYGNIFKINKNENINYEKFLFSNAKSKASGGDVS